jgi:hypothetical protein
VCHLMADAFGVHARIAACADVRRRTNDSEIDRGINVLGQPSVRPCASDDAETRGWDREVQRHQRTADRITGLLEELGEPHEVHGENTGCIS